MSNLPIISSGVPGQGGMSMLKAQETLAQGLVAIRSMFSAISLAKLKQPNAGSASQHIEKLASALPQVGPSQSARVGLGPWLVAL